MRRWLTPDPGGEKVVTLTDPQTWNMYSYVRDTPLTRTDPSGLAGLCVCTHGDEYIPGKGGFDAGDLFEIGVGNDYVETAGFGSPALAEEQQNAPPTETQTVTVTVNEVPSTAEPFGHATVGINGDKPVGLVPNSTAAAAAALVQEATTGKSAAVPAHIEQDNRKAKSRAVLKATPEQAAKMRAYIKRTEASKQTWDPGYRNCAVYVEEVLRSGGIKAPNDLTPGGLIDDLQKQNPQ